MAAVARLCASCHALAPGGQGSCNACGANAWFELRDEAIVAVPSAPCPGCGEETQLRFRGWVQHTGYVIGSSEQRFSAYLCRDCASRAVAKALAWTGLAGWWSLSSFFYRAPVATVHNWVAAFRPPLNPLRWGAIPLQDFLAAASGGADEADEEALDDLVAEGTPLEALTRRQRLLVLSAHGLYETLAAPPGCGQAELRAAYSRRAKAVHPDAAGAGSEDEMIKLNLAWEILRDEQLRAAYDWLLAQRSPA